MNKQEEKQILIAEILRIDEETRQKLVKEAKSLTDETKFYLIGKRVAYLEVLSLIGKAEDIKVEQELTYEAIKND